MKKLLLPIFLIFLTTYAGAQCDVGKGATYIYDDFSSATEPTGPDVGGLYYWPGAVASNMNRNTTTGALELTINQAFNSYQPFGVSFGDDAGDGTGNPYTIDLSGNGFYSVTVKNNHSTEIIRFRMSIQDLDGDNIDTDPSAIGTVFGGPNGNAWKWIIDIALAPLETKTLTYNVANGSGAASPEGILSGTFEGGAYANWGTETYEQNVNFAQIKAVHFTVINNANTGDTGDPTTSWQPLALTDVPIEISELTIGSCVSGNAKSLDSKNMSIAPNPATSVATVSYKATSNVVVNVSDVMGNLVKTVNGNVSSADIDVAGLNTGIYFVTIVADGTPVSAQKLLVE